MVLENGKNTEAQTQCYKTVLKGEESNIMLERGRNNQGAEISRKYNIKQATGYYKKKESNFHTPNQSLTDLSSKCPVKGANLTQIA